MCTICEYVCVPRTARTPTQYTGEAGSSLNADGTSEEGRGEVGLREKMLPAAEIALATSHESDSEEWVESSSDSSDFSARILRNMTMSLQL